MSTQHCTYRKALSVWLENRKSQMEEPVMIETMDFTTTTTTKVNKTLGQSRSYRDAVVNNSFEALVLDDEANETETSEDEAKRTDCSQSLLKESKNKKEQSQHKQNNICEEENVTRVEPDFEMATGKSYRGRQGTTNFRSFMNKIKEIYLSNTDFEDKIKMFSSYVIKECIEFIFEFVQKQEVYTKLISLFTNG